ncbi:glycoside hydrolase family 127 protein [Kineococcus terrestris]|uniref:glycoside hydrolase family 127 protein n=1 Tax=Kineococcus terrestris TaxID=2044856 RepID=UPI0034DB03DC
MSVQPLDDAPRTAGAALPVRPTTGCLDPLPLAQAAITGGFWARMQQLNRDAVIPHCDESLEKVGWIGNVRAAVDGTLATERVGRLFTDSEIYKVMEAMAWEQARNDSPRLRGRLGELTALLAAAQHGDGYLNTFYGYPGGPGRYSDLEWGHELYCAGHLMQAAVAMIRCGVDEGISSIARAAADHVCAEFADGAREGVCGHPEIETALVELYRLTGQDRYLAQARSFIQRRGRRTLGDTMYGGRDYYQDSVPVHDADVLVGHAVRALYLTAGAVDVAVESGDEDLLHAAQRQYDRTLERRTYLHGGMGAHHHGEAFGADFELPADRAYAETCAGIASIMVAWRLLLATGQERYADVIERTLYNVVAACPGEDGRAFFYVNTLHRRSPGTDPEPGVPSLRRTDGRRASWFTTSCCPTNVARTLASLDCYLATSDADGLQVHQYAPANISARLPGRGTVAVRVETDYPHDGLVRLRITDTVSGPWTLSLRIPGWTAGGARITGAAGDVHADGGRTDLTRSWSVGEEVLLHLDCGPRVVHADPRVDAVRGCVALERGPLVYCLESVDQPDLDLDLVSVDIDDRPSETATEVVVTGHVLPDPAQSWPDAGAGAARADGSPVKLRFTPYYRWANRGTSTMRVWVPTT